MNNYKSVIKELIEKHGELKWFDSGSPTCISTIYRGDGIIICHYYDESPEKVSFYYLDDKGYYIEEKGFECSKENECFELIKKLHGLASTKLAGVAVS